MKDFNTWNDEMLRLLDKLIPLLSETIEVWGEFNKADIAYFTEGEDQALIKHLVPIAKLYSGLRLKLATLQALKSRLADINRHEVCNRHRLSNHVANKEPRSKVTLAFRPTMPLARSSASQSSPA